MTVSEETEGEPANPELAPQEGHFDSTHFPGGSVGTKILHMQHLSKSTPQPCKVGAIIIPASQRTKQGPELLSDLPSKWQGQYLTSGLLGPKDYDLDLHYPV